MAAKYECYETRTGKHTVPSQVRFPRLALGVTSSDNMRNEDM
jgi:hypothetical protein